MLYIYAFENGTSVSIDGSGIGNINRGGFLKYLIPTLMPSYIQSNKPVEAYIFYKDRIGTSEVASKVIAPLSCAGSYQVTYAYTGPFTIGDDYSTRILCKTVDAANFTCSNPIIQGILMTPSNFIMIPATGNQWGFYGFEGVFFGQLTYSNSTGNFQISIINELAWSALRVNTYTSYSGLNLGPDRTLCPGDTILLDAGFGNYQYLWSTGDTTRTINVISAGTYWVQKTSVSCTLSDTIVITNLTYTPVTLGHTASICQGDSTLLNAGPGRSWYQWSTGQTTQSIYVHDSGTYWVTVPVSPCNFTTSDTIRVSVYESTGLGPDKGMCASDSVFLDAGPGMDSYLWNTGATTQTIWVTYPSNYSVIIHNKNCIFYDSVNVYAYPVQVVNLGPDDSICAGETKTMDAGYCTGCTYSWDDLSTGQLNIGNGQTYTSSQNGIYVANVTGSNGCIGRDTIQILLKTGLPVSVSISASANPVCVGTTVSFTATCTNGGPLPSYQWNVNSINAGTNNPVFTYSPSTGDLVLCVLSSSSTRCLANNPALSNTISMVVNPLLPVGVSISASVNNVCTGSLVSFTAIPVNGGSLPSFQWKVNGIPAGTNSPVHTYVPLNNDMVTCTFTSSETCVVNNPATSAAVIMIVNPQLPVGVSISASSNPFCIGTPVSFTASQANGGPQAVYQWKVNGVNAVVNAPVFTYNPVSGDVVTCVLTSSLQCVSGNPAASNTIIMTGTPGLPAMVVIAANPNPFCPGSSVTFTAAPGSGGSTPVFQWKVNGVNAGSNTPTFTFNPSDQDSVRCVMTSNLSCVSSNPAISNKVVLSGSLAPLVSLSACFDTVTTTNAKPFKLKGGFPLGGSWSGPGVNTLTGVFNPTNAGTGLKTIVYAYTNVYLCTANKAKTILVQPSALFTCGNILTDIRDGKTYPTVHIGTQCWMAANLNRGTQIPSQQIQSDNCVDEKYCHSDSPLKCTKYGGLYQWDELLRYEDMPADQGICPPGWHIPTSTEWDDILIYFNGAGQAGGPMKDTLLVNGFRSFQLGFLYLNNTRAFTTGLTSGSMYWTSTNSGVERATSRGLNELNPSVSRYQSLRSNAFSVRCAKD